MNTKLFRRYNYQKPFSAGVDKERKLHGHGYLVGEVCQTENPLPFHPRRDCEDPRKHDKWQFFHACIYDILKPFKCPREKTPSLNHLKAKTVRLHSSEFNPLSYNK
jgi:hypothetical protein